MKQYHQSRPVYKDSVLNRCTQRLTNPYMIVSGGGEGAVPHVTSSFYRRLPHTNTGLLPVACDWRPCRLCFPSRAIIRHCVSKGHQWQGQCLGLPGLASATFVCVNMYCLSPVCTLNLNGICTWSGKKKSDVLIWHFYTPYLPVIEYYKDNLVCRSRSWHN